KRWASTWKVIVRDSPAKDVLGAAQATTESPAASEATATAGGERDAATGATRTAGVTGVRLSSSRSSRGASRNRARWAGAWRRGAVSRAARACRDTRGRLGRLVRLEADEVLAAGDLHGHLENFRRLLQRADLAGHPRRHLVLQELVHGLFEYPQGGDKSHQLLD